MSESSFRPHQYQLVSGTSQGNVNPAPVVQQSAYLKSEREKGEVGQEEVQLLSHVSSFVAAYKGHNNAVFVSPLVTIHRVYLNITHTGLLHVCVCAQDEKLVHSTAVVHNVCSLIIKWHTLQHSSTMHLLRPLSGQGLVP